MSLSEQIEKIIKEPLLDNGYEIVRILFGGEKRKNLQVMIERIDGLEITVDDCEKSSRLISVLLDVNDPIQEHYLLEVSSPGIERPLVKLKDFQRFCGELILVNTHHAVRPFLFQQLADGALAQENLPNSQEGEAEKGTLASAGRKRFKGVLLKADENEITLNLLPDDLPALEKGHKGSAKGSKGAAAKKDPKVGAKKIEPMTQEKVIIPYSEIRTARLFIEF